MKKITFWKTISIVLMITALVLDILGGHERPIILILWLALVAKSFTIIGYDNLKS